MLAAGVAVVTNAEEEPLLVPENAKASLETSRDTWFLGENVLVHFKLENTGGDSFQAEFGGDYRGAGFAMRYKIKATGPDGKLADDLNHANHMGGLGGNREVSVEEPYWDPLQLRHYALINQPGEYEFEITHDFGWETTDERPHPKAKITLTFVEPSPGKAAELVEKWLAAPKDPGRSFGQKGGEFPNFNLIREPVYLKPLLEAARKTGDERAVVGIASILTPDATRALLEIASDVENPAWQSALAEIQRRLPDPNMPNFWGSPVLNQMRFKSWVPGLEPDARAAARQLLGDAKDYHATSSACAVLSRIGKPEDADSLRDAITREFERLAELPEESPTPLWHLQYAAEALIVNGAEISNEPKTAGESLFYIAKLRKEKERANWPANWRSVLQQLMIQPIPQLRTAALETLPEPIEPAFFPSMQVILKSNHDQPRRRVCEFVARDRIEGFHDETIETLKTASHEDVIEAAANASATFDRLATAQILVDRIAEKEVAGVMIRQLLPLVFEAHFDGWNTHDFENAPFVERWRTVVVKHEKPLSAGERLAIPHDDLTKELIPPRFSLTMPDGNSWPVWD